MATQPVGQQDLVHNVKRVFNLERDKPDARDYIYSSSLAVVPHEVDLRSGMPGIYDQGELGSCTANAVAAHLDYNRKKQGQPFINPSRLFIYWAERAHDGTLGEDAGSTIRESVRAVKYAGACPEAEWPYIVANYNEEPSQQCFVDAHKYEDLTYLSVPQNQNLMQACLAEGYPMVVGITVFESMMSAGPASTGMVPLPKEGEQIMGGHAVVVCGYKLINNQLYWVVRNSWGTNWGDQGYFYLPVSYLTDNQISSDFWSLRIVA